MQGLRVCDVQDQGEPCPATASAQPARGLTSCDLQSPFLPAAVGLLRSCTPFSSLLAAGKPARTYPHAAPSILCIQTTPSGTPSFLPSFLLSIAPGPACLYTPACGFSRPSSRVRSAPSPCLPFLSRNHSCGARAQCSAHPPLRPPPKSPITPAPAS